MRKFTLLELLVVIAIIGMLMTLLLPSLSNARQEAVKAVCVSNISQSYKVIHRYSAEHGAKLPGPVNTAIKGAYFGNWELGGFLSPWVGDEHNSLWKEIETREGKEYQIYRRAALGNGSYAVSSLFHCPGFTESDDPATIYNYRQFQIYGKRPYSNGSLVYYIGKWYDDVSVGENSWMLKHVTSSYLGQVEDPANENAIVERQKYDGLSSNINTYTDPRHGTRNGKFPRTLLWWDGRVQSSVKAPQH